MIRLESDHLPTINPSTLTAGANTMTKASHFPNLQTDLETIPLQRARLQFVRVPDQKYNITYIKGAVSEKNQTFVKNSSESIRGTETGCSGYTTLVEGAAAIPS